MAPMELIVEPGSLRATASGLQSATAASSVSCIACICSRSVVFTSMVCSPFRLCVIARGWIRGGAYQRLRHRQGGGRQSRSPHRCLQVFLFGPVFDPRRVLGFAVATRDGGFALE